MDNSNKHKPNKTSKNYPVSIDRKELNEMLSCSNVFHSNTKAGQLSKEEVTILWLKIKQNL